MTCARSVLIETPAGRVVRMCFLEPHTDGDHSTRYDGADLTWTQGVTRVSAETPSTVEHQPVLVPSKGN